MCTATGNRSFKKFLKKTCYVHTRSIYGAQMCNACQPLRTYFYAPFNRDTEIKDQKDQKRKHDISRRRIVKSFHEEERERRIRPRVDKERACFARAQLENRATNKKPPQVPVSVPRGFCCSPTPSSIGPTPVPRSSLTARNARREILEPAGNATSIGPSFFLRKPSDSVLAATVDIESR